MEIEASVQSDREYLTRGASELLNQVCRSAVKHTYIPRTEDKSQQTTDNANNYGNNNELWSVVQSRKGACQSTQCTSDHRQWNRRN